MEFPSAGCRTVGRVIGFSLFFEKETCTAEASVWVDDLRSCWLAAAAAAAAVGWEEHCHDSRLTSPTPSALQQSEVITADCSHSQSLSLSALQAQQATGHSSRCTSTILPCTIGLCRQSLVTHLHSAEPRGCKTADRAVQSLQWHKAADTADCAAGPRKYRMFATLADSSVWHTLTTASAGCRQNVLLLLLLCYM